MGLKLLELNKPKSTGLNMSYQANLVCQHFTSHNQYPTL